MDGLTMEILQQLQRQRAAQEQQPQQAAQRQRPRVHDQQHMLQLQMQRQRERAERAAAEEHHSYQRERQREYSDYNHHSSNTSRVAHASSRVASGINSVITIIPQNIWKWLKRFIKPDEIVSFDTAFRISTKYTPAFIVVLVCLSFCNQFFRNIDIDCVMSSENPQIARGGEYGGSGQLDSELNNYCWNMETFLVANALHPSMRDKLSYPGVSSYNREHDELIRQKYYKYVWFGLVIIGIITFSPVFIWNFKRMNPRLKSLAQVGEWASEDEENAVRATYYTEMIGFHNSIGRFYMFCKLLATATPVLSLAYLCGFVGNSYTLYGYHALVNIIEDSWPNPMDVVFPKVAKCEWAKYGFTGEIELKAAQCILPMNNVTEWSFLFLWWWLVIVFVVNSVSLCYFLVMWFPPSRNYILRLRIGRIAHEEVEKRKTYSILGSQKEIQKKTRSLAQIIKIKVNFGDWLVLHFLENSLPDYTFRSFINKLIVTKNPIIQLIDINNPVVVNNPIVVPAPQYGFVKP